MYMSKAKDAVQSLQLELDDLEQQHEALHYGTDHIVHNELPLLRAEFDKSKKLYRRIVDGVQKTRSRMASEKATDETVYKHRMNIVKHVKENVKDLNDDEEAELERRVDDNEGTKDKLSQEANLVKSALQQCDMLCNKIKQATGLSDLDVIYQKFITREELNKGLEEQALSYEQKLQTMKHDRREIQKELHNLQYDSVTSKSDDIRYLEQLLRDAGVRRQRAENNRQAIDTHFREAMIGLANVAKLLGFTSITNPRENVTPASQLWPTDQSINLSADMAFATSDQICLMLHLCEERVVGLMEMVSDWCWLELTKPRSPVVSSLNMVVAILTMGFNAVQKKRSTRSIVTYSWERFRSKSRKRLKQRRARLRHCWGMDGIRMTKPMCTRVVQSRLQAKSDIEWIRN